MKADITDKAQSEATAMIEKAHNAIEAEKKAAISELQGSVADLSISVASRLIGEDLNDAEHRKIIERWLRTRRAVSMPTNRQILKEKVATYASVLLDGAYEAGGQDAARGPRPGRAHPAHRTFEHGSLRRLEDRAPIRPSRGPASVRNLFASSNPVLVDALAVMAEREDFALLSRVWASYGEQLERKLNVTVVDATTVVELDDHLREVITKKAEADLGTNVVLREHTTSPCSAAY